LDAAISRLEPSAVPAEYKECSKGYLDQT